MVRNSPANAGDKVRSLVCEDSTCRWASGPVYHYSWARAPWSQCSATREATAMRSPFHVQQQRPSAGKKKKNNTQSACLSELTQNLTRISKDLVKLGYGRKQAYQGKVYLETDTCPDKPEFSLKRDRKSGKWEKTVRSKGKLSINLIYEKHKACLVCVPSTTPGHLKIRLANLFCFQYLSLPPSKCCSLFFLLGGNAG